MIIGVEQALAHVVLSLHQAVAHGVHVRSRHTLPACKERHEPLRGRECRAAEISSWYSFERLSPCTACQL